MARAQAKRVTEEPAAAFKVVRRANNQAARPRPARRAAGSAVVRAAALADREEEGEDEAEEEAEEERHFAVAAEAGK